MVTAPGCIFALTQNSLGAGSGSANGTLSVPDCWSGRFVLLPDFFAGVPYRSTYDIRMQRGSDNETFSDGIAILIDDVHAIRGDNGAPSLLGVPLKVALPAGVRAPGVPIIADPNPALVHVTMYLQRTCQTEDVALYAMDAVSLNAQGTCDAVDGGPIRVQCAGSGGALDASDGGTTDAAVVTDAGAEGGSSQDAAAAPARTGQSSITFSSVFDDNPEETDAPQRLTKATFHFYLADPRDSCPGGIGPPPPCRGEVTGDFSFYFERGKPGQPFP